MKNNITILLIDDNEIDNILNELIIRKSCFSDAKIISLSHAQSMDFFNDKSLNKNDVPDLIFLDLKMPLADGFVFLENFNSFPDFIKNKSIISILTSSLDEEDTVRAKSNKYVKMFINKPLSLFILEKIKNEYFEK